MDFQLTTDGDILLGQQLVDDEGYLLYYVIDESGAEGLPKITREVTTSSVPIRDFKEIQNEPERLQLIQSRLRTDNPDWYLYQEVGASLSDFIGLTNNPDTALLVENRVRDTLLRNNAFTEEELSVDVIPISNNEILVDVILDSEELYLRYAFSLDFDIGINNTYVLDREGSIIEEEELVNPNIYELPTEGEGINE